MSVALRLTVNGREHEVQIDERMRLVDLLRDVLRLTGTHLGCGTGNCGGCTVLLSGRTVKSCCILAIDANRERVTTIEAMSTPGGQLHPIQEAFVSNQGLQCGFCTPGMVLSAAQLLESNPHPTTDEIRTAIAGNLCRCTGYQLIVESIRQAASALARRETPDHDGPTL